MTDYKNNKILDKSDFYLAKSRLNDLRDSPVSKTDTFDQEVEDALLDDLNTPLALGGIHTLKKNGNTRNNAGLLGFTLEKDDSDIDHELINKLVQRRNTYRKEKNYIKADEIRNDLLNMGVRVKDIGESSTWEII